MTSPAPGSGSATTSESSRACSWVAIAFLSVVALAVIGDEAAVTLLVVMVVGFGLIALGTRMRG